MTRIERALAELETTLAERMGNLGELFGVVRQSSGDVQAALDDSMVSAQMPGRTQFLSDLAQRRELPTVPELQHSSGRDGHGNRRIRQSGPDSAATVERTNGEKEEPGNCPARRFQCGHRRAFSGLGYQQKPRKLD